MRHVRLPPSLSLPRKGGGNARGAASGYYWDKLRIAAHELNPPASVGKSSGRKP
jgi:hypothetical protein